MGKKATRSVYRNRVDYSNLLSELQRDAASAGQEIKKEPVMAPENKKSEPSLFRQRILSNEKVKYVYAGSELVIHDKSCKEARQIPDDDLQYTKEYPKDMKQCPECAVKAYVRLGAKDFSNYDMYVKLFEKMHFKEQQIRHIYVECGMQTWASANMLTIKCREDTWKIVSLDAKGSVQLLHNNYHVDRSGERCFDSGFHIQNDFTQNTSVEYAIKIIESYSFEEHQAAKAKHNNEMARQQEQFQEQKGNDAAAVYRQEDGKVTEPEQVPMQKGVLRKFLEWIKALIRKL